MAKFVSDAAVDTSGTLAKLLLQKTAALVLLDPFFKVGLSLVATLTDAGSSGKLPTRLLAALSTAENLVSAETAAQRLHGLAGGELYKLSSRSSQDKLKMSQQLLACVIEGRRLDVASALQCDFMSQVITAFQWFVSWPLAPTAKDPNVYGTAALHAMYKD